MSREPIVLTREALYEQVWSEPVHKIARQFGISGVALAKICRKLGVPVPPRGFWARQAAGHAVTRAALPPPKGGQPTTHSLLRRSDPAVDTERDGDVPPGPRPGKEPGHPIVVADQLVNPHPLVRLSARLLRKVRTRDTVRQQERCLDISATNATLNRALRIMDALIKDLERRGFAVEVTAPKRGPAPRYTYERQAQVPSKTGVHIGESFVEFGIDEAFDIIKIEPKLVPNRTRLGEPAFPSYIPGPTYQHRPNGKLVFRITENLFDGARRRWSDGKRQRLEDRLHDFVAGLIATAERMRLRRLEAERQERERLETERRREEEARRRAHEARLIYDLTSRIEDWTTAKAIREFLRAVEVDATERLGALEPDSELARWLAWAHQRADRLEMSALRTLLRLRTPPQEQRRAAWWPQLG